MRLVVTGGGTGGHVYPALEVARLARERGAELLYLGSLRGQEGNAAAKQQIEFQGFQTEPLYSLRTPAGWKSLILILRARSGAKMALRDWSPDVLFSTGGYSAAPVLSAAKALRLPIAIHEANSVPGRTHRMFGRDSKVFSTVFKCTPQFVPQIKTTRTGQPIRKELREAAKVRSTKQRKVLVVGGSQGSKFLNKTVPLAAKLVSDVSFIHASGPKNFEYTAPLAQGISGYDLRPYLETDEMMLAYSEASVVIARSGGTLAEIAMFGLPSILVPLPTSADDHQLHNANEFVQMSAATLLRQDTEATPEAIASAIEDWLSSEDKRNVAAKNLHEWDIPDATERIVKLVEQAAA